MLEADPPLAIASYLLDLSTSTGIRMYPYEPQDFLQAPRNAHGARTWRIEPFPPFVKGNFHPMRGPTKGGWSVEQGPMECW